MIRLASAEKLLLTTREHKTKRILRDHDKNFLEDICFVCTGIFESITREQLERFITDHEGRVVMAISARTDYLIIGKELEDGRDVMLGTKFKHASKRNTMIIKEKDAEQLFKELLGRSNFSFTNMSSWPVK